jgi:hypothetical protein
LTIIGLTVAQQLVTFRECSPRRLDTIGRMSRVQSPDPALVGIDFRVQDGLLDGIGGGLYTIVGIDDHPCID